jgi:hypothetical protein
MSLGFDHLGALRHALVALRAAWQSEWPGLGVVVQGCLAWVAHGPQAGSNARSGFQTAAASRLLKAVQATARIVEGEGARLAGLGCEPAYHNRLHIADTLVGMACLLRVRRELAARGSPHAKIPQSFQPAELMGLLAMLIHDFQHDGRVNDAPGELERHSLQQFLPHAKLIDLSLEEWGTLTRLVLNTDPATVGTLHDEFRSSSVSDPSLLAEPLNLRELAVLVTEADVLASVMGETGEALGRALTLEWTTRYPDRAARLATPEGRLGFLTFGARFSSAAALHLQIPSVVQAQVTALTQTIQQRHQSQSQG